VLCLFVISYVNSLNRLRLLCVVYLLTIIKMDKKIEAMEAMEAYHNYLLNLKEPLTIEHKNKMKKLYIKAHKQKI